MVAAGDIQGSSAGNATAAILRSNAHDAVITLGDNQYESGSLSAYNQYWGPNWGSSAPNSKLYPAPGNHEHGSPLASNYCAYFSGKTPVNICSASTTRPRYKWTVGSWDFFSLDTGASSSTGDLTTADKTWLDQQLAASTKPCQAVYYHHPRYSVGTHGNSAGLADDWAMMMTRHVDVVLSGHDHNYQRWNRMNATGGVDMANGIREFVVGTGGRSHYATSNRVTGVQALNATTFGVLKMTLQSNGFSWSFLPAGGTFTDSGTEACR